MRQVYKLTLEETKQNIGCYGAFMGLIQHNDGILADVWVDETLSLEHTIRHVLDARFRTRAVLETDRVTDFLSKPATNFLRHTFRHGHCSYTPGLSATYLAPVSEALLGQILGHLRRLAGTGITNNDKDLVLYYNQNDSLCGNLSNNDLPRKWPSATGREACRLEGSFAGPGCSTR